MAFHTRRLVDFIMANCCTGCIDGAKKKREENLTYAFTYDYTITFHLNIQYHTFYDSCIVLPIKKCNAAAYASDKYYCNMSKEMDVRSIY